jgi:hypothetical protein
MGVGVAILGGGGWSAGNHAAWDSFITSRAQFLEDAAAELDATEQGATIRKSYRLPRYCRR